MPIIIIRNASENVCCCVIVNWYPFLTNEKGRKTLNLLVFSFMDAGVACDHCLFPLGFAPTEPELLPLTKVKERERFELTSSISYR